MNSQQALEIFASVLVAEVLVRVYYNLRSYLVIRKYTRELVNSIGRDSSAPVKRGRGRPRKVK